MKEWDGYESNPQTGADLVRNWSIRPNGYAGGGGGPSFTIRVGPATLRNRMTGWAAVFFLVGSVIGSVASKDMSLVPVLIGGGCGILLGCALGVVLTIIAWLLGLLFGWLPAGIIGMALKGAVAGAVASYVAAKVEQAGRQTLHFWPLLGAGAAAGVVWSFVRRRD